MLYGKLFELMFQSGGLAAGEAAGNETHALCAVHAGVARTFAALVGFESFGRAGGDTAVKRAVLALDEIEIPVHDGDSEKRHTRDVSFCVVAGLFCCFGNGHHGRAQDAFVERVTFFEHSHNAACFGVWFVCFLHGLVLVGV